MTRILIMIFFGIFRIAVVSVFCLLCASCQIIGIPVVTAMHLANVADQSSTSKRAAALWDRQRENVRELQARGDPMGDYLYALGNAQGWIKDTSDPIEIRDLLKRQLTRDRVTRKSYSDCFIFLASSLINIRDLILLDCRKQWRIGY